MEGIGPNNSSTNRGPVLMEKKARPQEQLNCPRCNSTNTKFCYYNNYSLTQPRYFCKTCRRYWTEGGSLRNVPVGGGSRKNTKKPNNMISSSSLPKVPDLNPPISLSSSQSPKMLQGGGGDQGHDLNLAFPNSAMDHHKYHGMTTYVDMPKLETGDAGHHHSSIMASNHNYVQYSLMPNSSNDNNNASLYPPSGFPMQEVRPSLGFSFVDGLGNNRSSYNGVNENGRLLFPFGEIKHLSSAASSGGGHVEAVEEQNKEQGNSTTGYWTGMIGEGSSW